jgi:hypothetical protein
VTDRTSPPGRHGASAGVALAEALSSAWVAADRPDLGGVADRVGYARDTVADVLAGRVAPTWHLVRKLGLALDVDPRTVSAYWHDLWLAADERRRSAPGPRQGPGPGPVNEWAALRDSVARRDRD